MDNPQGGAFTAFPLDDLPAFGRSDDILGNGEEEFKEPFLLLRCRLGQPLPLRMEGHENADSKNERKGSNSGGFFFLILPMLRKRHKTKAKRLKRGKFYTHNDRDGGLPARIVEKNDKENNYKAVKLTHQHIKGTIPMSHNINPKEKNRKHTFIPNQ